MKQNNVDLVIKNARLLLETGLVRGGLGITDGKVCVIATDNHLPHADETIDVSNNIVMPGLIDAHAHLHDPEMLEHEDFTTGSRAAAAGGVTTVVDMPLTSQVDTPELVDAKIKDGNSLSLVDFALYGGMMYSDNIHVIPSLIEKGVAGFKTFTCDPYQAASGAIVKLLSEVSEHGGHITVHAEDQGIIDEFSKDIEGEWDAPISHSFSRPDIAEVLAVRNVVGIASKTGGHLHVAHLTTSGGIQEVEKGKMGGVILSTETCSHHLMFQRDDMNRLGPKSKMNPPLRSKQDRAALWSALLRGSIDMVVSDHAPAPIEEKHAGDDDIREAWSGVDGIQMILRVLLSEGINRNRITFRRLLEITSQVPAKLFGLYPKKGTLQIGSDADIVVIDHTKEEKISSEMVFTKSGWTLYEAMKMKGVPTMTILRGKTIFKDGQVIGEPGHGEFLPMGGIPLEERL